MRVYGGHSAPPASPNYSMAASQCLRLAADRIGRASSRNRDRVAGFPADHADRDLAITGEAFFEISVCACHDYLSIR